LRGKAGREKALNRLALTTSNKKDALGRLFFIYDLAPLICGQYLYLLINLLILLRKPSSSSFAYLPCSLGYPSGYGFLGVTYEPDQRHCVDQKQQTRCGLAVAWLLFWNGASKLYQWAIDVLKYGLGVKIQLIETGRLLNSVCVKNT
jgi:hypothetical protein